MSLAVTPCSFQSLCEAKRNSIFTKWRWKSVLAKVTEVVTETSCSANEAQVLWSYDGYTTTCCFSGQARAQSSSMCVLACWRLHNPGNLLCRWFLADCRLNPLLAVQLFEGMRVYRDTTNPIMPLTWADYRLAAFFAVCQSWLHSWNWVSTHSCVSAMYCLSRVSVCCSYSLFFVMQNYLHAGFKQQPTDVEYKYDPFKQTSPLHSKIMMNTKRKWAQPLFLLMRGPVSHQQLSFRIICAPLENTHTSEGL